MSNMFSKAASALTGQKEDRREDGESLTTVLPTPEDRSSLTVLIADCTEAMRQAIIDVFDAQETGNQNDLIASVKVEGTDDMARPTDQAEADTELAQRATELSEAKMKELKEAALAHFDEWKTAVIQRVGEVINSRESAEQQKRRAKPQVEVEGSEGSRAAASPMKFPELPKYDEAVQHSMVALYPPIQNGLATLPLDKKALVLHSVLLLLLSLENYISYSRVLLLRLSTSLHLPVEVLAQDESKVARVLLTAAENMNADEETKKAAEENKSGRRWKVGLATAAGAALIGITGGLAAPLLAAGLGTVMGGLGLGATAAAGYLGALAGSGVLVGGLFGAYGGRMTGKMIDQYAREVEDFAFVPVRDHHKPRKIEKEYRRLRVAVGISGWLTNQDEVFEPWKVLGGQLESFALRWELEALMSLGNAITSFVTSAAWSFAKSEIIKRTLFGALMAGLWPLGLLKISRIIDNPFSVANYRAQKAGDVLADALINKAQGERPVTLVGYSLGGKVIFTCLQKIAERKELGIIDVVCGRVVNVYSTKDYVLGFLYRSHSIMLGVAGLQAVENVKGVENVDVSDLVKGHTSYRFLTGTILKKIGFEDVDPQGLSEEEEALKLQEMKEEMEQERSESEKEKSDEISDEDVIKLEKEVEKKNEQSYIGWAQEKMVLGGTNAKAALERARAQWQSKGKENSTDDHPTAASV